ncbi:hypothetical protein B7492_11045 [Bacillus mycoides]|uniref:Uncharacterized protein n=1 Tax=Bacillus mycoides TaxID=1405 RepID=A0A1W6A3T7_BACMY|nr:hypothetical protein B7492_04305 [Bacillus mycoides]ARJ21757.1 hypothetical protein B7492_11045 [Bacillus mycoides]
MVLFKERLKELYLMIIAFVVICVTGLVFISPFFILESIHEGWGGLVCLIIILSLAAISIIYNACKFIYWLLIEPFKNMRNQTK